MNIHAVFKMVDTCAAEFDAATPYYYSTYDEENESVSGPDEKKVLVLGSGPIRIGQGIEFDYCSVHSVWALKRLGLTAIIVNNNPRCLFSCTASKRQQYKTKNQQRNPQQQSNQLFFQGVSLSLVWISLLYLKRQVGKNAGWRSPIGCASPQ